MPPTDEKIDYSVKLMTAATSNAVGSSAAKVHMNITASGDNEYILTLCKAAEASVQQVTNRQLVTATYELNMDRFPVGRREIRLPRNPVQSVSSVVYTDTDGSTATFSSNSWTIDTDAEPARLYPVYGEDWPSTQDIQKAVKVTFIAGYGGPDDVPDDIKHAIKLHVSDLYEHREPHTEAKLTNTRVAAALVAPYRLNEV
jgi:uncharacterized phiE125 gp8 family phage protein